MLSLLVSLALSSHAEVRGSFAEERYLADRDAAIAQVSANPKREDIARGKLEAELRKIIGNPGVSGFKGPGKLNLETLQKDDPGFGQLDGLMFDGGAERLFVTTPYLFVQYAKANLGYRSESDLDRISRADELYPKIFGWDAAYTLLANVPLDSMLGRASLAFTAQDIGPFPPKNIVIFTVSSRYVLVLDADLTDEPQIAACQAAWRKVAGKAPTPKTEDNAFAAYRKCWSENAAGQPFFAALKARVNAIAKRLDLP